MPKLMNIGFQLNCQATVKEHEISKAKMRSLSLFVYFAFSSYEALFMIHRESKGSVKGL
jgi:hypothetical protein